MMTLDDAIRQLRSDPGFAWIERDAYLGEDALESARRFYASAEFIEVQELLVNRITNHTILDLGAGNGIASRAFCECGARLVYALEPSPSSEVGRGALYRVSAGQPIYVLDACGEEIPLPDESIDVVYARQVLHHTRDLSAVMAECARVLRRGGVFLACREHVVDSRHQLESFLQQHPVHRLAGGENAFPLSVYTRAIASSGLVLNKVLGPWDTIINAFPAVRSRTELNRYPRFLLGNRFGRIGVLASLIPGMEAIVWARLKRPIPGRMYSFLAIKPC